MKIYIIVYAMFDGECSFDRLIKAFTKEKDAEKHALLCKAEGICIKKEVDAHYAKHKDELESIATKVRWEAIQNGKKKLDERTKLAEMPESIRRKEIIDEENEILDSNKYDPGFMYYEDDDPNGYSVTELELD